MREFNFIVFFYNQHLKSSQMYFPTDHFYENFSQHKRYFLNVYVIFANSFC
jgi:hypothetical protein